MLTAILSESFTEPLSYEPNFTEQLHELQHIPTNIMATQRSRYRHYVLQL